MKKKVLKLALSVLGIGVLVGLDQLTKLWAVNALKNGPVEVIKNVFSFHYVQNTGMAFGLLENQQWFFYVMTAIFMVVAAYVLFKTPENKRFLPMNLLMVFIVAGALGNLIDRVVNQYVVDFLYFKLIDFPVFNVADCYVSVSIILLAIYLLFFYKDKELAETYGIRKKEKQVNE